MSGITVERFQSIVLRVGNYFWCRHWFHWNYPQQEPWLMAISCIDSDGITIRMPLEKDGFTRTHHGSLIVYTIPRIDGDGKPYTSSL